MKTSLRLSKTSNSLLLVLIIIFFSFSLCSLGLRQRYGFFILGGMTLFLNSKYGFFNIKISPIKKYMIFMVSSLIILYLIPSSRYDITTISFYIYVLICTLVIVYAETDYKEIMKAFKVIKCFSIVLSLYITFFRIVPELYFKFIYPILSERTAEMMLENSGIGYGAAVGQSYTFSDYVMMLGISLIMGNNLQNKGKYNRYKVLIIILCLGILFEGRKGELLSTILSIIFVSAFFFSPRKIKYLKPKIIFMGCSIVLAMFTIPILYKQGLLYRFVTMLNRMGLRNSGINVDFTSGRFDLWINAINLFLAHPILGAGWGRFANYTTGTFVALAGDQAIKDVHNCFLQLLCETGIVGSSMILIPLFWIYKKTILQTVRLKHNIDQYNSIVQMNVFSLCMQTYFLLLFFLDPVFYNPFYWCSFAIVVIIGDFAFMEEKKLIMNIERNGN